jgi:hypothetical protein
MAQQGSTWGDPTAAGLFATAAGTTATWAFLTGKIAFTDASVFLAWLFGAALLLTMVGLIALKRGDTTTGVVNLCFGVLFFGTPALSLAFNFWGGSPLATLGLVIMPTNVVNGFVYFVLGIILATFVPILGRQSGVISIGLLVFVIGIFFLAFYTLHGPLPMGIWATMGKIAGWCIGVGGWVMLYIGIALTLLYGFGRLILPVGKPICK